MTITKRVGRLMAVVLALLVPVGTTEAQTATPTVINGKVTDANGNAIPGANVVVPALGLSVGANTRVDGTYTIVLPQSSVGRAVVVTARRIGFAPVSRNVTIAAGDRKSVV